MEGGKREVEGSSEMEDRRWEMGISDFGFWIWDFGKNLSDLDILVRFRRPLSLLRFTSLQRRLSRQVGRPVDLVTEDSLSPYLRRPIHRQQILLHGER